MENKTCIQCEKSSINQILLKCQHNLCSKCLIKVLFYTSFKGVLNQDKVTLICNCQQSKNDLNIDEIITLIQEANELQSISPIKPINPNKSSSLPHEAYENFIKNISSIEKRFFDECVSDYQLKKKLLTEAISQLTSIGKEYKIKFDKTYQLARKFFQLLKLSFYDYYNIPEKDINQLIHVDDMIFKSNLLSEYKNIISICNKIRHKKEFRAKIVLNRVKVDNVDGKIDEDIKWLFALKDEKNKLINHMGLSLSHSQSERKMLKMEKIINGDADNVIVNDYTNTVLDIIKMKEQSIYNDRYKRVNEEFRWQCKQKEIDIQLERRDWKNIIYKDSINVNDLQYINAKEPKILMMIGNQDRFEIMGLIKEVKKKMELVYRYDPIMKRLDIQNEEKLIEDNTNYDRNDGMTCKVSASHDEFMRFLSRNNCLNKSFSEESMIIDNIVSSIEYNSCRKTFMKAKLINQSNVENFKIGIIENTIKCFKESVLINQSQIQQFNVIPLVNIVKCFKVNTLTNQRQVEEFSIENSSIKIIEPFTNDSFSISHMMSFNTTKLQYCNNETLITINSVLKEEFNQPILSNDFSVSSFSHQYASILPKKHAIPQINIHKAPIKPNNLANQIKISAVSNKLKKNSKTPKTTTSLNKKQHFSNKNDTYYTSNTNTKNTFTKLSQMTKLNCKDSIDNHNSLIGNDNETSRHFRQGIELLINHSLSSRDINKYHNNSDDWISSSEIILEYHNRGKSLDMKDNKREISFISFTSDTYSNSIIATECISCITELGKETKTRNSVTSHSNQKYSNKNSCFNGEGMSIISLRNTYKDAKTPKGSKIKPKFTSPINTRSKKESSSKKLFDNNKPTLKILNTTQNDDESMSPTRSITAKALSLFPNQQKEKQQNKKIHQSIKNISKRTNLLLPSSAVIRSDTSHFISLNKITNRNNNTIEEVLASTDGIKSIVQFDNETIALCLNDSNDIMIFKNNTQDDTNKSILVGHTRKVNMIIKVPAEKLMSCSADSTMIIWDIESDSKEKVIHSKAKREISNILYLGSNMIASTSFWTITIWDYDKEVELFNMIGHNKQINSLIKLSEECLCTAALDSMIKVWSIKDQKEISSIFTCKTNISAMLELTEKKIAFALYDNSIKLWNIKHLKEIATLKGHEAPITYLLKISKETCASTSKDFQIIIWNIKTFSIESQFDKRASIPTCLCLINNGNILAGFEDFKLEELNIENNTQVKQIILESNPSNNNEI